MIIPFAANKITSHQQLQVLLRFKQKHTISRSCNTVVDTKFGSPKKNDRLKIIPFRMLAII